MSSISSDSISTCSNCGKGGEGNSDGIQLKSCAACRMVKYCSRECQIAHRPQHKKECKKRAAELHDELLFKQPPPNEECPICMIRLPSLTSGRTYMSCCGKMICSGCMYANAKMDPDKQLCPFCRTPIPDTVDDEETIKRLTERMEMNDAQAMYNLGTKYRHGLYGLSRDMAKAIELWHRAGKLGCASAYHNIGCSYESGDGAEMNMKQAKHYYELAAIQGHTGARHNLGGMEGHEGDMDRALKHYMIAAHDGDTDSMEAITNLFKLGIVRKSDYAAALKLYQTAVDEIKSDLRDEYAAFSGLQKYY